MKKLALIVLLAVVASRVLADRDERHGSATHRSPLVLAAMFGDDSPAPPPPPSPPKRAPKSKRRGPAATVVPVQQTGDPLPAWFPKGEWEEEELGRPNAAGARVFLGRLSASPERAQLDLRKTVSREIGDWLAADIPPTWDPPQHLIDRMILGTYIRTETRTLGGKTGEASVGAATPSIPELDEPQLFYRAGQKLDFGDARRARFVEAYQREVASVRMRKSGSILAVILAGLAVVSFYVRADEATKGYYTNRLRVLAAGGLGAAGAVAYRYWV